MMHTAVLLLAIAGIASASHFVQASSRNLQILNNSGKSVDVYWLHPETHEATPISENLAPGAELPLNSYVGHEFEIRGRCFDDETCNHNHFTVKDNNDQKAEITPDLNVHFLDNKIKATAQAADLVESCRQQAANETDYMLACVQEGLAEFLVQANEEIAFQASVRRDIAATLENYTCVDSSLDNSPDIGTSTWMYDNEEYTVHIKHERTASRIHTIEHFITEDECQAMEDAASRKLHDATVADGKGGSRLSDNRKAKQAGVPVPWDKPDHPITNLSRRMYAYVNDVLKLELDHHGQEDLMSIQYFGRGRNDTEPDRYTPHCDGECTGDKHKSGTRMATIVTYCHVAETGGHTNFRNSGVHVKPELHNAIFFSYIDPETKVMDTGFTEHSGCPVFEGVKKIVVQWFRMGVSDEEPWTAFNTLGIKYADLDQ